MISEILVTLREREWLVPTNDTISGSAMNRRHLLVAASFLPFMPIAMRGNAAIAQERMRLPRAADAWPQHTLLRATPGAVWEARLSAKPVLASRALPAMNDPAKWIAAAPATITTGVTSFRIASPMMDRNLLDRVGRRGSGATSYVREGRGAVYWRHLFTERQNWSEYNRVVMQVRPADTGLAAYRLVLALGSDDGGVEASDPLPFHFLPDLKPGKWNTVIWEFSELPRGKVNQFAILMPLLGPLGAQAQYEIKDFQLQRTEPEHIAGWAVAPGKIACNHHGYELDGAKIAIARPGPDLFQLVSEPTGRVAASLPAKKISNRLGSFALLEFDTFRRAGTFHIRYGSAHSAPFVVGPNRSAALAEPLINFFYADRCGHRVDGLHDVCHTELFATHGSERKLVNGGWHDAGNLCQGAYRTTLAARSLFDAHALIADQLPTPQRGRLLEEACWGLDWLLKTRFGKGVRVIDSTFTFMQDGRPETPDEVTAAAGETAFESFLFVWSAADASAMLAEADPARAFAARAAAVEDYDAALASLPEDLAALPEGSNLPAPHEVLAYAALAALALKDATGETRYGSDAKRFADRLLALQETRLSQRFGITGYYSRDPAHRRRVIETHTSFADAPAKALSALHAAFPLDPDRMRWYAAVAVESECFLLRGAAMNAPYDYVPTAVWKPGDIEPYVKRALAQIPFAEAFGAPDITPSSNEAGIRADIRSEIGAGVDVGNAESLRTFPIAEDRVFHGGGTIQLARALSLVSAARLRRCPELAVLARRQLDWQLGLNPFAASLVHGVGQDYASQMLLWAGDIVGAVPVGMDARRDQPFWPHTSHMTSREMWIVPAARMLSLTSELAREPAKRSPAGLRVSARNDGYEIAIPLSLGFTVRDVRLQGHNIALAGPLIRSDHIVWPATVMDKSKAWVVCLEDLKGMVLADHVGPA